MQKLCYTYYKALILKKKGLIYLKRAISVLLILATLMGCCTMLFACKKDKDGGGETSGNGLKYSTDAVVDFSVAENITASGLEARTDVVKTAANSAAWKTFEKSSVEFAIPTEKKDMTLYKELSVWINNTSAKDIQLGSIMLISDNAVTENQVDGYKTIPITVHPGWHQYNIPFSEMTAVGSPYGFDGIQKVVFDTAGATNTGGAELLIDTIYFKTQKYGSTKFFKYDEFSKAVVFYDENNKYLFNQLRYVLEEGNENVCITSDAYTTYVPVAVLALHRGATDISASAEKVSFNYNGTPYEFTPNSDLAFTGIDSGFIPGQNETVKPVVMGQHLMLPMEYCANLFGYKLCYNQMGLVIFSDIENITLSIPGEEISYEEFMGDNGDHVYDVILEIINDGYTGKELLQNMDELYGVDGHTKVLINQDRFDHLRELVETDPVYSAWFRRFESSYQNLPTKKFVFGLYDGYRMLDIARELQELCIAYGFLYKMTDKDEYAEVVLKALLDYAAMVDPWTKCRSWHVEHPIDFGEILYGYGLAYDWLYDWFEEEDRLVIEDAAWEIGYGTFLGFGESMQWWADPQNYADYQASITDKEREEEDFIKITGQGRLSWYYPGTEKLKEFGITQDNGMRDAYAVTTEAQYKQALWVNNYNAVCNGGLITFVLAFANVNENFRAASEYTLDCTNFAVQWGFKDAYIPDGGYPEGPGYWDYGTRYSAQLIEAMHCATGIDQSLIDLPGFSESFYYSLNVETSTVGCWNYHDAGETPGIMNKSLIPWAAWRLQDKDLATVYMQYAQQDKASNHAWAFMYYQPELFGDSTNLPLDAVYNGLSMSMLRSDWETNAVYAGLHGGWNNWSHSMHDIGQFIVEFDGVRFFTVLGKDEYNITAYVKPGGNPSSPTYKSNPQGYWLYRNRAEGTNTLVIDPVTVDTNNFASGDVGQGTNWDQLHAVYSKTLRFESGENSALAIVDMSVAYDAPYLSRMVKGSGRRGLLLTENRSTVVIQDEFTLTADKKHVVYWFGHTPKGMECTISDDGKSAILTMDGKSMLAQIVVPKGATYDFNFSFGPADYLPETGLTTVDKEYSRVGWGKLIAKGVNLSGTIKLAIVCRPLTAGASSYTYTNLDDWKVD